MTQRDWRDDRIDELEQQLQAVLQRIAELEERLGTSSRSSSKPPSSDSPKQQADRKKKAAAITKRSSGKRKPGGQPGHKMFSRQLVPAAEVDHHDDCIPESCELCAAKLRGRDPSSPLQTYVCPLRKRVHALLTQGQACHLRTGVTVVDRAGWLGFATSKDPQSTLARNQLS